MYIYICTIVTVDYYSLVDVCNVLNSACVCMCMCVMCVCMRAHVLRKSCQSMHILIASARIDCQNIIPVISPLLASGCTPHFSTSHISISTQ